MAETLKSDILKAENVDIKLIKDYDLIGFGSGIYDGKFHKNILNLVNNLKDFSKKGIMEDSRTFAYAEEAINRFGVIAYSSNQIVGNLSGGNQQKILIAQWLEVNPKVLIFDEPTRGVDIGAKSEIYTNIKSYSSNGNASIVISSEIPELMGICDRIIVVKDGKIVGTVLKDDFTEERIVGYATGVLSN